MVNLIAINGYAGSGKDTVGKIIQYLTSESSNKRTFDEFLSRSRGDNYFQTWYDSPWEIKKYATKLKQIASILTGIPVEKFEDPEFKKQKMGEEWWHQTAGTLKIPMNYRTFLQVLGTEAIRDKIHPNTWGNALFVDYIYYTVPNLITGRVDLEYPKWIITDVRFQNEADIARKRGAVLIRVNREGVEPVNNHPSEISLDDYEFDHYIENNGNIEDLIEKVRQFLINIGVLHQDESK